MQIPLEITDKECNKSDTGFSEKVNLTGVNVLIAEDNELAVIAIIGMFFPSGLSFIALIAFVAS